MWTLTSYPKSHNLWFSDGEPINTPRGGNGVSSRLIVDKKGFLDITDIPCVPDMTVLDANGCILRPNQAPKATSRPSDEEEAALSLELSVSEDGSFSIGEYLSPTTTSASGGKVSGKLKPLPEISPDDVHLIRQMIEQKHIPYPDLVGAEGRTNEELRALGESLFPFTPHSFEVIMCIYSWTTPSFVRMALFKIFEYTGLPDHPLDIPSLAQQIWRSNWEPFTPQDKNYMNSFLMKPADSLRDVQEQLDSVSSKVHTFSTAENRLCSSAAKSLPRTPTLSTPQLFSGQVDISQLGLSHFGIEFLESPLNNGPATTQTLEIPLKRALESYILPGHTITSKAVISFSDSLGTALPKCNGILLVANPPPDSWVWEEGAFVKPVTANRIVMEYSFMPGTRFEVQGVDYCVNVSGTEVWVITLQPTPREQTDTTAHGLDVVRPVKPLERCEIVRRVEEYPAQGTKTEYNLPNGRSQSEPQPSRSQVKLGYGIEKRRYAWVDFLTNAQHKARNGHSNFRMRRWTVHQLISFVILSIVFVSYHYLRRKDSYA